MQTCKINNCSGRVVGWGWCEKHYRRWKRGKDVAKDPNPPKGWIHNGRYYLTVNGKVTTRARLVLQEKLGRELLPHEITHHIDENKLNDDPSNLEVHTKTTHMMKHQEQYGYKRHPANKSTTHRRCSRCKEVKTIDNFYPCPSAGTGTRPYCRMCQKIIDHEKHLRTYIPNGRKRGPRPKLLNPLDILSRSRLARRTSKTQAC